MLIIHDLQHIFHSRICFNSILLTPQLHPVTAQTMNYSAPIIVFVCGGSLIWYWVYWVSPNSVNKFKTWLTIENIQHRCYTPPNAEKNLIVGNSNPEMSREESRTTTKSSATQDKHASGGIIEVKEAERTDV